ncbi:transcriptional regulator, LacI family [Orenia metallireducens]|uniref:Transcriptional regulator, LacI family n=2 Tax=Orenia metallireducens TaxID=1413210 RepID=A0A285FZI0_9FIRM|nr:transcriptional regulator, LacI family [Orenia metallireducens]
MIIMKVTIQDIADRAEVSPSTVSRVLNNKGRISEKTEEKVLAIAQQLGYKSRNSNGKSEESKNIAIIFNNKLNENLALNHFYSYVMEGVEVVLKDYNYHLFFKTITEEDTIADISNWIDEKEIAGLIFAGYEIDKDLILSVKKKGVPVVLVDNDLWDENIDCVVNDNVNGSRKIINHLIELGHKKIAFLSGPLSHVSLDERYIGYKQSLKQAGIEKEDDFIVFCEPSFEIEDGYEATKEMFAKAEVKPTAIFGANDKLAIGAMKAVQELGYSVPKDISIVGFDDIDMSEHLVPSLATVRIFKKEMGQMAAKRLYELINGVAVNPIKLVISVETIIRDSVAEINQE